MTDRAKALLVYLDDDYRLGDEVFGADRIMAAISSLRGVTKVEPLVADHTDALARERVKAELRDKVWELFK